MVEVRGLARGVRLRATCSGHRRVGTQHTLERIREAARRDRKQRSPRFSTTSTTSTTAGWVARIETRRGGRNRRRDVATLREALRQPAGPLRAAATRRVPSKASSESVHPEAGRAAKTARRAHPGRQGRPAGHCLGAERHLRAGLRTDSDQGKFGLELHPDKTRLVEFGRTRRTTGAAVVTASRRRSPCSASRKSVRGPGRSTSPCSVRRCARAGTPS